MFPKIQTVMENKGFATEDEAEEWMRTNITGTGSFQMDGWVVQNGMFLTAFVDHWDKVPFVEKVRILEVPEASTRRAMLESGEAQIAGLALKDWPALLETGQFLQSPEGSKNIHGFPVRRQLLGVDARNHGRRSARDSARHVPALGR